MKGIAKFFASVVLLLLSVSIFAEVTAKKNDDGTVDVTFFYGNPRAEEVVVAGSFTDWQNGALPMEKTDKGWTLTVQMKESDDITYKFISDGNWTTDLKSPMLADDGFGGKNGRFVVSDLIGGSGEGGAKQAKIVFSTWTTMGIQANYLTVDPSDPSTKGLDLNSVTVGMKSYDKFDGQFLPGCPFHLELALAEIDMEDYEKSNDWQGIGNTFNGNMNYLYKIDSMGDDAIGWDEGFRDFFNGIFANPVSYFARAKDNEKGTTDKEEAGSSAYSQGGDSDKDGPGFRPIIGHLKFGWDTPIINFQTGFNYAKPDQRQAITWVTLDGSWDAGYKHTGGFFQFSMGDWAKEALSQAMGGVKLDLGFAPNRSADRKGYNYGLWTWVNVQKDDLVADVQVNGMYGRQGLFYEPVEHNIILGIKDKFSVGPGKLDFAVQWLFATHERNNEEILRDWGGGSPNITDFFGYSTDVFWRSGDFDGIQNMAGNIQLGYAMDVFNIRAEYKLRGMQASQLYIRENHDDGAFLLSDQLGRLNSQQVTLNVGGTPIEGLNLGLNFWARMPLEELDTDSDEYKGYNDNWESWYRGRFSSDMKPNLGQTGGAEIKIAPSVSYNFADYGITIGAYIDMKVRAYQYTDNELGDLDDEDLNKYSESRSIFKAPCLGASLIWNNDDEKFKGIDFYYGCDLDNDSRFFNTLAFQFKFFDNLNVYAMIGIKSENTFTGAVESPYYDKKGDFDGDANNPFAFAIGISKQFKRAKAPVIYGQFVFNTDPFQHFGGAQEQYNLDRANINGSWNKEGDTSGYKAGGSVSAVDWYDGRAALRFGCRWSI